ncbi:hypothetical protein [Actinomadura sp. 7K507]|uniref:hypothetical protein n=1 Tax=Actinomadura sp. 7K507 TaxID=2530365 RepID=UPI001FB5F3D3|nr:hypothetical protein [Actinomadura sp. 7K507]
MHAADDGGDLRGVLPPGAADGHPLGGDRAQRLGRHLDVVLGARVLPAERPVEPRRGGIQHRERVPEPGAPPQQVGHQPAAEPPAALLGRDRDRADAGHRDRPPVPPLRHVVQGARRDDPVAVEAGEPPPGLP